MLLLVIGLAIFIVVHLIPTAPEVRRAFVERFGEMPYKIAFSVVAAVGLAIIAMGYAKLQANPGKNPVLWTPPHAMRHAAMLLMLIAFVLLAAAYIPSRIRTVARHPMLAAVKLWALAHLLVNGDLGSIVLFGSLLAWAIYDRITLKSREAYGPLGKATGGIGGDLAAIAVGIGLFTATLTWAHTRLFGVPLIGT